MASSNSQILIASSTQSPLHPVVAERLGSVIAAKGLILRKGNNPRQVWLENPACRLVLTGYEDNEVVCTIAANGNPTLKGQGFEMHLFLFARWGAAAARFLPQYPDCGCEDRRTACLQAIAAALSAGALDGPLRGDFAWAQAYHRLVAEAHDVGGQLVATMTHYRPELEPLRAKWSKGDLSWIQDAKAILRTATSARHVERR